jgi:preprotein translocase SecE subunit
MRTRPIIVPPGPTSLARQNEQEPDMAVAVKSSPETQQTAPAEPRLLLASFVGAVYVLASFAVVLYGVPKLWAAGVTPWLEPALGSFVDVALRLLVQAAAAVLLVLFGNTLAGPNPPLGLRGGIFMTISGLITLFFFCRAAAMIAERNFESPAVAQGVAAAFAALFVFVAWRIFRSGWHRRTILALERQGWLSATPYKRNQGVRVRRLTMLGVLLLLGSGIFSMMNSTWLATLPDDWTVALPFTAARLPILPDVRYTLPLVFIAGVLWFAYRLVNVPTFADFLVATEAEMNKVSWSTRKQLIRDTIVVLITVAILTVFLLIVDLFWGWILSRDVVGVLPSGDGQKLEKKVEKIDW